jgi:hypothetical protein
MSFSELGPTWDPQEEQCQKQDQRAKLKSKQQIAEDADGQQSVCAIEEEEEMKEEAEGQEPQSQRRQAV